MERRTGQRIDLELECQVFRPGLDAPFADGFTVNMSHGGALIWFRDTSGARVPKVDHLLELEVPLPQQAPFERRCVLCQASVLRVSASEPGSYLVALKFHRVRFREMQAPKRMAGAEGRVIRPKLMVM
jgi:hypothetical protein